MLFLVKRGDYFYARKAKQTLFALKRGKYFYATKAKHTLYGVWYTTISIAKEIRSLLKEKQKLHDLIKSNLFLQ